MCAGETIYQPALVVLDIEKFAKAATPIKGASELWTNTFTPAR